MVPQPFPGDQFDSSGFKSKRLGWGTAGTATPFQVSNWSNCAQNSSQKFGFRWLKLVTPALQPQNHQKPQVFFAKKAKANAISQNPRVMGQVFRSNSDDPYFGLLISLNRRYFLGLITTESKTMRMKPIKFLKCLQKGWNLYLDGKHICEMHQSVTKNCGMIGMNRRGFDPRLLTFEFLFDIVLRQTQDPNWGWVEAWGIVSKGILPWVIQFGFANIFDSESFCSNTIW